MQREHAIVNPGGTGTPRFVISARFAPLPPRIAFMSFVPSAFPSPKKNTDVAPVVAGAGRLLGAHCVSVELSRMGHVRD